MLWDRGRKCKALAARFVATVNAHDAEGLRDLVTEDFTNIDSWREGIVGRETAIAGARVLFEADSGFRLDVESMSFSAPYVLMRGWVESDNPAVGRRRAVWRATCAEGRIAEWQSWSEEGAPPLNRTYSPANTRDMSSRAAEMPDRAFSRARIRLGTFGRGRGRVAAVRRLVDAFEARDWTAMSEGLAADFRHVDAAGRAVNGRAEYLAAVEAWIAVMPDATFSVDAVEYLRGMVIARGRLRSLANDLDEPTTWCFQFAGRQMRELRALRAGNKASLISASG